MYDLFDSTLRLLWDYFGWWLGFMFVGLCLTDVLFPEKKNKLKDYE